MFVQVFQSVLSYKIRIRRFLLMHFLLKHFAWKLFAKHTDGRQNVSAVETLNGTLRKRRNFINVETSLISKTAKRRTVILS